MRRFWTLTVLITVVLLGWLPVSATFSELPKFLTKKSCTFEGDGCNCIARVRSECCCKGRHVDQLPADLLTSLRVLFMYNTSVTEITSDFFSKYIKLEELEIDDSPALQHFDSSCLANLTNLRKVSVTKCRSLREISGKLLVNNLKIQSLILRNNGLLTIPSLRMGDGHRLEVDIDLSGNQIKFIGNNKVRDVRARTLKLNNNKILEIEGYAFNGSSFVKLSLDNNLDLADLSMNAFKNVKELHHLDLSYTSITILPINGLKNLKTLRLKAVPTLKRLPSVLSFTQLETAHFTYPHHCCLFNHVDDVVVNESGQFQKNAKEIQKRMCSEKRTGSRRQVKREASKANSNFLKSFFDEWIQDLDGNDVEESDEEEELPPFSEIGAKTCHSVVEEVQSYYRNISCYPRPDALNPCESIVGYPLLRIAIWGVWLMAIVGNVLVWVTLALAYERRMKVHYLYMINMSVADALTGVYLALLAVQDARTSDEYYRHAVGWQTGWGCRMAGFLAVFASELSIISMFLIAFEMSYNTRMAMLGRRLSARMGVVLLVIGWAFALTMGLLPWAGVSSYSKSSICLPLNSESWSDKAYLIFGLLFNVGAFVAMAFCYGFIVKMLKENETREEDKALITKMAILVVTDLVCWFPTFFFGLTASLGTPLISLSNAKIFLVFFFPINSFANPFLYVFFTEVIQRRVKSKTIPVLRRITTGPGRSFNTLSNFYHSQPPGSKSREDVSNPTRLGVTQTTSLNSTPRGSGSSYRCSDATLNDSDAYNSNRLGSTPRVSFQCDASTSTSPKMESASRRSNFLKRFVSAIPEVSDLSEHSSESHHEHVPKTKKASETSPTTRMSFSRLASRFRNETNRSFGQDSGRGSIASSFDPRDQHERLSLVGDSKEALAPTATPFLTSSPSSPPIVMPMLPLSSSSSCQTQHPSHLVFPWHSRVNRIDRRMSAPAVPVLVVSDFSEQL